MRTGNEGGGGRKVNDSGGGKKATRKHLLWLPFLFIEGASLTVSVVYSGYKQNISGPTARYENIKIKEEAHGAAKKKYVSVCDVTSTSKILKLKPIKHLKRLPQSKKDVS